MDIKVKNLKPSNIFILPGDQEEQDARPQVKEVHITNVGFSKLLD
jgi:hypothetical protein